MPNLNEFFEKNNIEAELDPNVEVIQQMRPCSKCDVYVDTYLFNKETYEMYWKCINGHETRFKVG